MSIGFVAYCEAIALVQQMGTAKLQVAEYHLAARGTPGAKSRRARCCPCKAHPSLRKLPTAGGTSRSGFAAGV